MTTRYTQPLPLTKIHKAMLAALDDGDWHSRSQLAVALGRHPMPGRTVELYARDKECLQELVDAGVVECRQGERVGGRDGVQLSVDKIDR